MRSHIVAVSLAYVFVMFATWVGGAEGAERLTPDAAYAHAQALRGEAQKLAPDNATPAELRAAASKLQEALDYLAQPEVRAMSSGNFFLAARRYDVLRDLAGVHAQMRDKAEALHLLELMQQEAWIPVVAKLIQDDPHFRILRDEPRFKAILNTMQATARLWSVPAIATPYKERLTVEERIAGLSLFWEEARHDFAYFDHVPDVEWDHVYIDFLPKVMAADTTRDYYRVMMQLAPLLRDGHTNIYPPKDLLKAFYARPPLRTERLAGKVYITRVASASLAQRIHVGDEITAIDGIPVERYANEQVAPFVSSSTPQDREVRMYTYQLLSGDAKQPVRLTLRSAEGTFRTATVDRDGYTDLIGTPEFEFRMLPHQVAYLALDHFETDAGVKAMEAAMPQILHAKALVLDVRHNGGGSSQYGLEILSYLIAGPIQTAQSRYRGESGWLRTFAGKDGEIRWDHVPGSDEPFVKERKEHFSGPVALLIGPQTFSAAEDFVMYFDNAKRGILVGSATAGSTGQPLMFGLPGGGTARICVKRDTYPDGREFVGKGISPNVAVTTTIEAIRSGADPVLNRAIEELLESRN